MGFSLLANLYGIAAPTDLHMRPIVLIPHDIDHYRRIEAALSNLPWSPILYCLTIFIETAILFENFYSSRS